MIRVGINHGTYMELLTEILSIIGTVAFAVSGALVAIDGNLDIFGVCFVGGITAIGGGVLRDMMLGIHPPASFTDWKIPVIALGVSVLVFIVALILKQKFMKFRRKLEAVNNVFDAVGLAAFSITGVEVAVTQGHGGNWFIIIVSGMLTGICGGIFRDLLTSRTPSVLRKHVYALPSIIGSAVYYALRLLTSNVVIAASVAAALMIAIRLLATRFRWDLPKVRREGY